MIQECDYWFRIDEKLPAQHVVVWTRDMFNNYREAYYDSTITVEAYYDHDMETWYANVNWSIKLVVTHWRYTPRLPIDPDEER